MKTLQEFQSKNATLRLLEKDGKIFGIVISNGTIKERIEGTDRKEVWQQLTDKEAHSNPKYFGFEGAKTRFKKIFPKGFKSLEYAAHERDYKLAAKQRLDETVPIELALNQKGQGEKILSVFRATNLLSPYEGMRIQDMLRSPLADAFIHGAATFANGDMKQGLANMAQALKAHDVAKWTAITYLPYLWRPNKHMFLKPLVTHEFAERVGHSFSNDYTPELKLEVYDSLLNLTNTTAKKIADLEPEDNIDVQSFIWVVGAYEKNDAKDLKEDI